VEAQTLLLSVYEGEQRMPTTESGLPASPLTLLSDREHDVLRALAEDRTDREIAARLGIRERTVRAHVSRIILKLGVASRVGAAVTFVAWTLCGQADDSAMAEAPMATMRARMAR
jgi:DNA-binding NarL/FixJ family response regulator